MAQLTINYKPADKTYDVIVAGGGTAGVMAFIVSDPRFFMV